MRNLILRRIKFKLANKKLSNRKASFILLVFILFFIFFGVNIFKQLLGIRDDRSFLAVENSQKVSAYDDRQVETKNYVKNYVERQNSIDELVEYRNKKNRQYKHILLGQRSSDQIAKVERGKDYLIVQYTPIFGNYKKLCRITKPDEVYLKECPVTNCHFSCDPGDAWQADALIFSEFDLRDVSTEASYNIKMYNSYSYRKNQIWILWTDEPYVSSKMNQFSFNWTMSYRQDAEVSDCAYGCTYPKAIANQRMIDKFYEDLQKEFVDRKRLALWAVSNCRSKRIDFALKLNEAFPLKVLGICENYFDKSKKNKSRYFLKMLSGLSEDCGRESDCERELFKLSKFYLSFESRNCTDYITEKFWRILRTGMIPVVLQPSKEVYKQVAPPDSFIHAEDFDFDEVKLAVYLNEVSTDLNTYLKHHVWKLDYDVVYTARQTEKRRLCELCIKMNQETSKIYYDQIPEWFDSECYN